MDIKLALIDKTTTLGPTRNHEAMDMLAGLFVERGVTRKDHALRLKTAVKLATLHAKFSTANAYRVFAERPGFVVTKNSEGDKVVYYQWEELKDLVEAQDAEYYPKNFGPLTATYQIEIRPEPEWKFHDSNAWTGRVVQVPVLTDAALAKVYDFVRSNTPDLKNEHIESYISALITMYENGEFYEDSSEG